MTIAPEGRPFVGGALIVGLGLAGLGWAMGGGPWWIPAALWLPIVVWVPWFFRNPDRTGPRGDHLAVAPADGRVVSVTEVNEPEVIGGTALRISIFMNVFDVHVNRHPVDGEVTHRMYHPGRFLNAALDKASEHNERLSLGIAGPRGPLKVTQIAGLVARRIKGDHSVGDRVRQGARLGIIRFGSRVDTFLVGATARVAVGDRTRAGETVIAVWPA